MLSKELKREILESIESCNQNPELLSAYRMVYLMNHSKKAAEYFDTNSGLGSDELKKKIESMSEFNFDRESVERQYEREFFADLERGRREALASL